MALHFYNTTDKGNGYEFSLFPIIAISKTKWLRKNEYDIMFAIWFWGVEINFVKEY